MNRVSQNSSAIVHLWFDQPDPSSARTYSHVSLEVEDRAGKVYMSFWKEKNPETPCGICPAVYGSHFHPYFEVENNHLRGLGKIHKAYLLHSLNIKKIKKAFEAFKKHPFRWGALGWGIWGRSYNRNASGVVGYLLDKGGVFDHISYEKTRNYSIIFNTVTIVSCMIPLPLFFAQAHLSRFENDGGHYWPESGIYPITGFHTSYGLVLFGSTDTLFIDYFLRQIQSRVANGIGDSKAQNIKEIVKETQNMQMALQPARRLIVKYPELVDKWKKKNDGLETRDLMLSDLKSSLNGITQSLGSIGTAAVRVALVSICLGFLYTQFFLKRLDTRDIAIIAKRMSRRAPN